MYNREIQKGDIVEILSTVLYVGDVWEAAEVVHVHSHKLDCRYLKFKDGRADYIALSIDARGRSWR